MGVQKRIAQIGFAKQTAKGAAAAAPTFTVGLTGGTVYSADISQDELNTTWSTRGLAGHDRISVVMGSDFEAVAMPKSIGLLLNQLLGTHTVTGASAPFTHTFKPANALPWATLFGLYGTDKVALSDAKIDSIELSWDKTGALKVKVTALGIGINFTSAWVIGTTGETVANGALRGGGGLFNIDGAAARVTGGSIKIENACEPVVASVSGTPDDIFEGDVKCDVSLTIVPDDLSLFRRVLTGTTGGTVVNPAPQYGTVDLKFVKDANTSLEFLANHVAFMVEMPEADPSGGAAELSLEGSCALQVDGTEPFSFVLMNDVATY